MLTPEEIQIIEYGKAHGMSQDQALQALSRYRATKGIQTASAIEQKPAEPKGESYLGGYMNAFKDFGDEVVAAAKKRFSRIQEIDWEQDAGQKSRGSEILQAGGQVAGFGNDLIFSAIKNSIKGVTPDSVERSVADKATQLFQTEAGQQALAALGKGMDAYKGWKKDNEELALNIEAVVNIVALAAQIKGLQSAGQGINKAAEGASKTVAKATQAVSTKVAQAKDAVKGAVGMGPKPAPGGGLLEGARQRAGVILERGKNAVTGGIAKSRRLSALPKEEAKAIRAGVDENVTQWIKSSQADDIDDYAKMIDVHKASLNPALRTGQQSKEIAAKTILQKAVKPVVEQRNAAGKAIRQIVDDMPKSKYTLTSELDDYLKELEKVGVTVEKGKLVAGPTAVKGDLGAYQDMLNRIATVGKDGTLKAVSLTRPQIHGIRSAIFKEFSLAKARQMTFSSQADDIAENFRRIIAKPIVAVSDDYMVQSTKYAKSMRALQDFVKWTTYKGNLDDLTTQNLRVGEVAQRMLGNASARPQEVMDAILNLADDAGGSVRQSIMDQIRFSDLLDDLFGSPQTRGIGGAVARGTAATAEGVASDVVTGGVVRAGVNAVKTFFGGSTKETQAAFEAFVKSLVKQVSAVK